MNGNEHRRPSTYSSSTSPSSNGHPSSSNTSPSPPRSSASPPDELVLLSLASAGGGDGEEKEGRQHRTVPCKQCRSIRRVCRWVEGRKECERCLKRGFACSGPLRRGKATLTPFVEDVSRASLMEEELDLVPIGPCSPTEGWNRTHMSYALTHHLVETCLKLSHAMTFPGVDVQEFESRFHRDRGRTSELSLNHELLSLVYMGIGAQLTDHTAILGASSEDSAAPTGPLGLIRRPPILNIVEQIAERLEDDRRQNLDTAAAIDRLGLAWMALEQLHMPEHGLVRHRLLGETILQGLALLEREDFPEQAKEMAGMYLQGLAREELRQSLECGVPSALSPHQTHVIFGPPPASPTLYAPDNDTLAVVFSSSKDTLATSGQLSGRLFGAIEQMCDHLDYVLAYAPRDKLPAAVAYIWRRLDELHKHQEREFCRIFHDPRYIESASTPQAMRAIYYISTLAQLEMFQVPVLWGCHLVLERLAASAATLEDSERRIFRAMSVIVRRFSVLPQRILPGNELGQYLSAIRLTLMLDLVRERFLLPWSAQNPAERDILIDGLREASERLPEAARLVQLLEAQRSSKSSPSNPS